MQEPAPNSEKLDRVAYILVWSSIVHTLTDVRELANSIGFSSDAPSLEQWRKALRTRLTQLRGELTTALGDAEADELLLPLVLYCDELVLNKLSNAARPIWPLLQTELFQINNGGERFFAIADEKLQETPPPALLLEVLCYCLGHGFLGRHLSEPAQVLPYKTRLAERLQLLTPQQGPSSQYRKADRKARTAQADPTEKLPGAHLPLIAPAVLYLATLLVIFAISWGVFELASPTASQ